MLEWVNSLNFPGWTSWYSACIVSKNNRSIMNKLSNIHSRISLIHSSPYLIQKHNAFLVTVTESAMRHLLILALANVK